jgi:PAS domain S-box-containing protein
MHWERLAMSTATALLEEPELRLLTDALPLLIAVVDREHRHQFNNKAYESWFEVPREELKGKHLRDVVGDAAYQRLLPHIEAVLAGRQVQFDTELGYRGGSRLVGVSYVPRVDSRGDVTGFVALVEDISSRRQAELRLQVLAEASRALFEAKLDLPEVLDTICREVATRLRESCAINLINPHTRMLELAANFHVRPEVHESIRNTLTQAPVALGESVLGEVAQSGKPVLLPVIPHEQFVASARPEYRPHLMRYPITSLLVVPLRVADRIIGTLTASRDRGSPAYTADDQTLLQEIADRASLVVENARLFKQAQDAVEARDAFLSVASHELRTPLTALKLQVEMLRRAALSDAPPARPSQLQPRLDGVARQLDRLGGLVEDLLDVSRAVAGRLPLDLERLDLAQIAVEVTARFQEQARLAGSALEVHTAECTGQWDRLRLDQIVTNLVSNAVKFGHGRPIAVEVGADAVNAMLTVRDDGIGIAAEDQARIFQRFEQAVSKRHFGGLGLGLWIVRQIVDALGGTITVCSQPGAGSEFTVTLPRWQPIAGDAAAPGAVGSVRAS